MNLLQYPNVPKLWGTEIWLVNNDQYCAKFLIINPGYQCSLHMHPVKKETFFVMTGDVVLETGYKNDAGKVIGTTQEVLNAGDSRTILPGEYHRFKSATPEQAVILEISTTHDDADVVRLEDSRSTTDSE